MKNKTNDIALGVYYYDDDMQYYQEYKCGVCNCSKFIKDDAGEDYEYQDEVGSYIDWYNYVNNGFVSLECNCGNSDYVLVETEPHGLKGWVCIVDYYQDWKSCPKCGNEEDLERLINEDEDKMTMNCPKCKSENIFEI